MYNSRWTDISNALLNDTGVSPYKKHLRQNSFQKLQNLNLLRPLGAMFYLENYSFL